MNMAVLWTISWSTKWPMTPFFICVNASNQDKDFAHIRDANRFDCEVEFASAKYAQLAIQGPKALETAQKLTDTPLAPIRYYWFTDGEFAGVPARIARTGYTGEDGFEVYVAPEHAVSVWNAILEAGRPAGIKPCGLGARNTLRLESKMALYGHEIGASISPLEADLAWIVKFDKGEFIGRDALLRQREKGLTRKLVGFEMRGRGIGRDGYEVLIDGEPAGWVTSGSPAPTLNRNIGLCYLPHRSGEARREDRNRCAQSASRGRNRADAVLQEASMNYPESYRYTKEHEWVSLSGRYGDHRHYLPRAGRTRRYRIRRFAEARRATRNGKSFGSVESVKAVSDIYAPLAGEVIEANDTAHGRTREAQ